MRDLQRRHAKNTQNQNVTSNNDSTQREQTSAEANPARIRITSKI